MSVLKDIFFHNHRNWWSSLTFILFTCLASLLAMGVVHPDLLIHHQMVFSNQHETSVPFESIFVLLSQYYHGGVFQLWESQDQMSYSFTALTAGFYSLANLMTAATYILASPFFDSPSQAYQAIYSVGFHASAVLIRTMGGYLLLRRFCQNSLIIFIALLYQNTFLVSDLYIGSYQNSYYSLFPLLIFFIVRFFESFRLNDFLGACLVMTVTVAGCPLFALGYFYQAVHFFIVCSLFGSLLSKGQGSIKNLFKAIKGGLKAGNLLKIILIGGICLGMMMPVLKMQMTVNDDFYIPEKSYSETEGRFENKLNIAKYFSKANNLTPTPRQFFWKSVDFKVRSWGDFKFLGFSSLLFASMGFIFSRHKFKHHCLWTIVLAVFLLHDRDPYSLFSIAHWINVLSNPFHFLIRAPAMTILLVPFLIAPLIALGLQSLTDLLYTKNPERTYHKRTPQAAGLLALGLFTYVFCAVGQGSLLEIALRCLLFIALISLVYLYSFWKDIRTVFIFFLKENKTRLLVGCVATFFLVDLALFSVFVKNDPGYNVRIFPGNIEGIGHSEPVIPIYQNPKIFPFREFYRGNPRELVSRNPKVDARFIIRDPTLFDDGAGQEPSSVSWYRLYSRQSLYGGFYHFTHLGRFFFPATIYNPVNAAYKNLAHDFAVQDYLMSDQRIFSFSDYATDSNWETFPFDSLLANRKVVSLESDLKGLPSVFPNKLIDIPIHKPTILGSATMGSELKGAWVATTTGPRKNKIYLTLSAVNQEGKILALANTILDDSPNFPMIKFTFPNPIIIEKNQAIQLILTPRQTTKIKQNQETGQFVFFEDTRPIPYIQDFSFLFKAKPYRSEVNFSDYIFDLPKEFPKYLASTIFTEDQHKFEVSIGNQKLLSAQGKLVSLFTYDIQNIATGKLMLRLPKGYNVAEKVVHLRLRSASEIIDVWRNEHDNLGINYKAPKDGWLVIHFPFDERWRLTIDNKDAKFYRANKYFVSTPIRKGQHKILIQYWPNTFLRELILASVSLKVFCFFFAVFWGLRLENSPTSNHLQKIKTTPIQSDNPRNGLKSDNHGLQSNSN